MVKQKLLIVNLKNYSEVAGRYSIKLAMAAERVVPPPRVKIVVAPSAGSLAYVANAVSISICSAPRSFPNWEYHWFYCARNS
jgi:triosephosphate isomerase